MEGRMWRKGGSGRRRGGRLDENEKSIGPKR